MHWLLDGPLEFGALPRLVSAVGAAAFVFLVIGRGRPWWLARLPAAVAAAVLVVAVADAAVWAWAPFPDHLPARVLLWATVGVGAAALAVARTTVRPRRVGPSRRGGGRRRATAGAAVLVAVLSVLATAAVKVNAFYGYRPTLADALGLPAADQISLAQVPRQQPLVRPRRDGSLAQVWRAPPGMPARGSIATVDIPGPRSGFAARPGWVYLPPAYLTSPRPSLPVLVLVAGQPGGPRDWLLAGRMADVMDRFAAGHQGLAPVVVVPDATGSALGNPLCLDSRLGQVETYLAADVPAWIDATLQTDPDPARRAIGGFSYGGTCALQLAVRHPGTYPSFLDISGDAEPSLGSREQTIAAAFGGDAAAFRAVNPLDVLAATRLPTSAGLLAAGDQAPDGTAQLEQVRAAAQHAGMDMTTLVLPGGHTWAMATTALTDALPWLAGRLALTTLTAAPPPGPRHHHHDVAPRSATVIAAGSAGHGPATPGSHR